jgi:hypothetical protein
MPASTLSQSLARADGIQSSAPSEVQPAWTRTDQLLARATAWALFGVGLLYILTTTAGFVIAGGLQAPIVDPAFALMELLILVEAPLIVVLFVSVHRYATPSRQSFSLAAFGLVVVMTALTLGVHFVVLTVGRQVDASMMPGFDRFLASNGRQWSTPWTSSPGIFASASRCCWLRRCLLEQASSERSALAWSSLASSA